MECRVVVALLEPDETVPATENGESYAPSYIIQRLTLRWGQRWSLRNAAAWSDNMTCSNTVVRRTYGRIFRHRVHAQTLRVHYML